MCLLGCTEVFCPTKTLHNSVYITTKTSPLYHHCYLIYCTFHLQKTLGLSRIFTTFLLSTKGDISVQLGWILLLVQAVVFCMELEWRSPPQAHRSTAEMLQKKIPYERISDLKHRLLRWSQTEAKPLEISLWFCEIKHWVICLFELLLWDHSEESWQNPAFTVFKDIC